jgi:hypothetical protein
MAQTGFTPISIYYSSTATNVPTAGNLVAGELAINTADGKLFYKDSSNVVQVIGTKGGVGSSTTTQVLYNSSGLVVGSANMTFSGTALTLANDASISGLTVGKGGGAVASNTVLGTNGALAVNTSGANDVAVGAYALQANTTGSQNVGVGQGALYANTTGSDNTAIGFQPLASNTTGGQNVAIGRNALALNTTASNNTAVGYQAGYSNTVSANNTYIGYQAGYNAQSGASESNNTFVGRLAGYSVTTGISNTFYGQSAGYNITTGSKNTIVGTYNGNQSSLDIRTASNYIVLSDGDGNPRQIIDGSGNVLFGVTSTAHSSDGFTLEAGGQVPYVTRGPAGTFMGFYNRTTATLIGSITNVSGTATAFNTTSDYRLKENIAPMTGALAKVAQLKPCTYTWKSTGEDGQGFIAHELQEVVAGCVTGEKDAVDAEGKPIHQAIDVSFLVATLTSAIQELKAEVDSLKQQLGK